MGAIWSSISVRVNSEAASEMTDESAMQMKTTTKLIL